MFCDKFEYLNLLPDAKLKLTLKYFALKILVNNISNLFIIDSMTFCQFFDKAK